MIVVITTNFALNETLVSLVGCLNGLIFLCWLVWKLFTWNVKEKAGISLRKFNVNIYSDEVQPGNILHTLKNDDNELIDLRPYIIEFPQKVSRFSKLSKALELFRTYHLRHLLVINPKDDSLAGIITRKDLDAFMKYDYDAVQRKF